MTKLVPLVSYIYGFYKFPNRFNIRVHFVYRTLCNMAATVRSRLVQVTNISPLASAQNVREIFSYLGDIEEFKVYPEQ